LEAIVQFLNPRTDFAFKKIFGSQQNKAILISFLNAFLYEEQPTIEDLEILDSDPSSPGQGLKNSYLNVKARITNNKIIMIEIQVLNVLGCKKQILYNTAKTFSDQIQSCADYYDNFYPVIGLTITDFLLFPHSKVISHYGFKEANDLPYDEDEHIELVFVELPKFSKSLEALETLTDRWIYFLREAENLNLIPESFMASPLRQALEIANLSGLSPEELETVERTEIFIRDNQNAIAYAQMVAMEEGMREGLQKGMEQGMEQGQRLKAEAIARSLLGQLPLETISQATGLSLEDLQNLRDSNPPPSP